MKASFIFLIAMMGFWNKKEKTDTHDVIQRLEIYDDSGFIGVVNRQLYEGFIREDWELEEIFERFRDQMNKGHCAVWSIGLEQLMSVENLDKQTERTSYREISVNIKVTDNCLWLTNYTDLTMAAQFKDELIPSKVHSELKISLVNGDYKLLIRQLFNPDTYDWDAPTYPCYELIFQPIEKFTANELKDVIWWDLDKKY